MSELLDPLVTTRAVEAASPTTSTAASDAPERIRRLKQRFLYCWNHPLWRKYREAANEDMGFHTGEGQWEPSVKSQLQKEERACLTINEIRPVVGIVVGYERQGRMDIRPVPEGQEDRDNVSVLGRIMKRVMQDDDVEYTLSDGFKSGVITGMQVFYVGVDYTEDLIHGQVTVTPCARNELCWDPAARRYDLRDAQDVFWVKMVPVDVLKSQYPDAVASIDSAISVLDAATPAATDLSLPAPDPTDAYKESLPGAALFWDGVKRELAVIEAWYATWETVHLLVDQERGQVQEVPEGGEPLAIARQMAATLPNTTLVTRKRRAVAMSVFLPAANVELESGNPYDNDTGDYPFVPYIAYREDDEILGIVRNLKDAQREVNKRRSALIDNVAAHGSIRWKGVRSAVENPAALETTSPVKVIWLRGANAMQALQEVSPPPLPEWIWRTEQLAKADIREISGVNAPMQGIRSGAESGVAIGRLQLQGQVITSELFDNWRRTKRLLGKRLAKRIQQVYTGEMTLRLATDSGGTEFVTINSKTVDPMGRQRVERDIPSLRYDVEIADAPSSPTARSQSLGLLLELIQRYPQAGPALLDIIIELTDIPNRQEVLARVRALMAKAGVLPDQGTGNPSVLPTEGPSAGTVAAPGPVAGAAPIPGAPQSL